ncbi:hypothetical protein N0V93_006354 [Gnomoniopsis smithogilvyi]|uniref:NAD-dependent epimerase/dehydratase domain-containing protein n=1 Tax=Gnomoniopsis smithogilvyi TaxID=1191159 RepID=A0A9W9CUF0_9PEZI|nr:hypothetical protein N0V93_006354 [Gnomoniopsis smithogilvyi]
MAPLEGAVLPQGSWILVTGVNGFVGSHVADQFLQHGYNVRGTVRDAKKNAWVARHFETQYGTGRFELVELQNLTDLEATKKALEGCAGFAATASDVTFSLDPNNVIPQAVQLIKTGLEAAAATPSVKRFVQTSSSATAWFGEHDTVFDITTDTWNTRQVEQAWATPPHKPDHGLAVYCASKTKQEQEAWKYVKERKPGFVFNAVLPDYVIGKILSVENQGYPSSLAYAKLIWDGDMAQATVLPPQYEVDSEDIGRLHVAAMLHPDAQGERIFGFAYPKNATLTVQYLRELYPERQFKDVPGKEAEYLANILPRSRAEELLKWVKGGGWTGYKESLRHTCDTLL